uniref:Uncharacterized protein n=1 Tax=Sphaerodactylus townsendi TaxID=933632 RepID=A0ACB8FBK7_9SAUR
MTWERRNLRIPLTHPEMWKKKSRLAVRFSESKVEIKPRILKILDGSGSRSGSEPTTLPRMFIFNRRLISLGKWTLRCKGLNSNGFFVIAKKSNNNGQRWLTGRENSWTWNLISDKTQNPFG